MTVFLPFEAVFAWAQQIAGVALLTNGWLYRFGAQARVTSDRALRTSGTFDDPFQLAALAVLGTAGALFLASRWQAQVLLVSSVAILAATSVRSATVQMGLLLLVYAVRRGLRRQALALGAATAVAGLFTLVSTTSAALPGGLRSCRCSPSTAAPPRGTMQHRAPPPSSPGTASGSWAAAPPARGRT